MSEAVDIKRTRVSKKPASDSSVVPAHHNTIRVADCDIEAYKEKAKESLAALIETGILRYEYVERNLKDTSVEKKAKYEKDRSKDNSNVIKEYKLKR
jgi:hypothetical protein